jgi:chromate transport protein ChrA
LFGFRIAFGWADGGVRPYASIVGSLEIIMLRMTMLKALAASVTIVVSVMLLTVLYAAVDVFAAKRSANVGVGAVGLAAILTSPLYWLLVIVLIGLIVWLFLR